MLLRLLFAVLLIAQTPAHAQTGEGAAVPEKAVCRACEIRGAEHGEEKVAASREHEGVVYHFCSAACAEAFDKFPRAYIRRPLPRPAPAVVFRSLDGTEVSLESLRGRPVLVDFWATWCKPCIKALPKVREMDEMWSDRGLVILGVSIDEKDRRHVKKFVEKEKMSYPVMLDNGENPAWHAFEVAAIPAMFLIDAHGRIVAEWKGAVDLDAVRGEVETLLTPDEE